MATAQTTTSDDLNLVRAIDLVAKEKGIERDRLARTVEDAICKAAQSVFGMNRTFRAELNESSGQIDLFQCMTVVDDPSDDETEIDIEDAEKVFGSNPEEPIALGEVLDFQIFWHPRDAKKAAQQDKEFGDILGVKQARSAFGRIAAQTAKQVLVQRVRDEERDILFDEFKDKKGTLVKGVVRRFERGNNLIVDLERTEGVITYRDQTPRERFNPGDRIVAYVRELDREARGALVLLSRSDARLVEKLFEAEVPEIYEGIVKVVACAREAGARTKIAVTSRDADVDPVGACVGMKGARVQAVVQELRGEKIDIVPFDRDPARFVCNAIAPATVNRVIIDEGEGRMELVVPDEKLSLAIGRKGQNVRLAAQLTGWKLDVLSESKFRQMEEEAIASLSRLEGVDANNARAMYGMGFRSLEEVAEATDDELASMGVVGDKEQAHKLRIAAESTVESERRARVEAILARDGKPTEGERLRLVRGVSDRVAQLLEEAGYRTVEDVDDEEADKLASRAGIGIKRARLILHATDAYITEEEDLFPG